MKHQRRGICSGCSKVYTINRDGRVREHVRPDSIPRVACPGAGLPPTDSGEATR